MFKIGIVFILLAMFFSNCQLKKNDIADEMKLQVVTYEAFEEFVKATQYITDAEKYGWSVVQQDVFNFTKVENANWWIPNGVDSVHSKALPVTQVSYNDAIAYCEWSSTRLPSYEEYWEFIKNDNRKVVTNNNAAISAAKEVNVLGNVWEITSTNTGENIRLAGGSLFCSPNTCHGTSKARELYVDKETGNIHIGFAVVIE